MPKLPPPHHPASPKALRVPGVRKAVSGPLGRVGGDGPGGGGKGGDDGGGPGTRVIFHFVIPGIPRTKKNSPQIVRRFSARPKLLPSKAYARWERDGLSHMFQVNVAARRLGVALPLTMDLNCRALFYRNMDTGDATGFHDALADFMQKAGIVKNDVQIRHWDGTRLLVDRANSRVEVFLELLSAA